jgi:nicotinate-nucleotide adenylyltransferase
LVKRSKPSVALFGGSFDPPHAGHQAIVERVAKRPDIDKLIVVPAYLNPFKTASHAGAVQRLTWCRQLFADIPKVQVDAYEIEQGRSIPTAESLRHFQKSYDVNYLVIGADNLSTLTQWHQFAWLNDTVTWLIVTRSGHMLQTDALKRYEVIDLDLPCSSTDIRDNGTLEDVDSSIRDSVQTLFTKENIL